MAHAGDAETVVIPPADNASKKAVAVLPGSDML